jgi:hypothetical protein
MFNNWNLKKHILMSSIISIGVAIFTFLVLKPISLASSIGIISATDKNGPSAIYTNFGLNVVIVLSLLTFVLGLSSYKFIKDRD